MEDIEKNPFKSMQRKQLSRELTYYIQKNDLEKLEKLFEIENNLKNLKENRFIDPFIIAIQSNNLHLFDYFDKKGFKLRGRIKHNRTSTSDTENRQPNNISTNNTISCCKPLIEAIKCLNIEAVDLLIKLGVNVNSNNYKYVPIQIAYNIYSVEREKFLLNKHYNSKRLEKSLKIIEILIHNNVNTNIYNSKGYRLIHQVVLDKDLHVLELILKNCQKSLKIDCLTYGKMQNCLHLVSEVKKRSNQSNKHNQRPNWMNDIKIMSDLNLKLAKILIAAGCNMNHRCYQLHETPVFKALLNNYYELVKLFVVEGFDMSFRNIYGNDVLSRSIQLGRYKIARLLIAADSPIRVYSCFYKVPSIDEITNNNTSSLSVDYATEDEDFYNAATINNENFLQYSLQKYNEFLTFIQKYTQEPRSLVDLSRLCVRNQMKKPISNWLTSLNVPRVIQDIILLKDIEDMILIR